MKKYSKQREAILNVLRETNTHPTANWIYNEVRKVIPKISLGTVYRNLDELSKSGEILSLNTGDGFEHFDFDIKPHIHLCCSCCDSIADLELKDDILSDIAKTKGFMPSSSVYMVYGICENCKN